jgi:hypothetical protein
LVALGNFALDTGLSKHGVFISIRFRAIKKERGRKPFDVIAA